jgi:YbgC/YbaW family acyl-CoA thioester hydrolase
MIDAPPNDGRAAPFVVRERVRWSDVDKMGIIRYDAYVRFFELGEMELFRAAGFPFRELTNRTDITLPRKVLHQDYVSPCVLDELLTVHTTVTRLGTTSLTLGYEIFGDGDALRATGYMVLVAVDPRTFEKRELPGELRRGLARFVVESR